MRPCRLLAIGDLGWLQLWIEIVSSSYVSSGAVTTPIGSLPVGRLAKSWCNCAPRCCCTGRRRRRDRPATESATLLGHRGDRP
jgi:hypothetical protein